MRESNLFDWLLYALRLRRRFRVTGASMVPTLGAGDEVMVDYGAYRRMQPGVGDVVVACNPSQPETGRIVKRIVEITVDGRFHLHGDNLTQSTDSRRYGPVPRHYILGKVTSKV